jgi:hypothetical protein
MVLKQILLFSLMATAGLSLLVAGCSKSNNSGNIPIGMSFRINGQTYVAKQATGTVFGGADGYYLVGSTGVMGGDTVILTVFIATPIVLNKKVCTDTNAFAKLQYQILRNNASYASYTAAYGDLDSAYYTITALDTIDHTIAGTFSGTITIDSNVGNLPDSLVMANGQFKSSYQ